MPALAIDTATEVCALALGSAGSLIDEASPHAGRSHLEMLLAQIEEMLARNSLKQDDISAIVVGTGPGTFSGLRVGISTARALAQALKVPLAGHSTLKALALGMAAAAPEGFDGDFLPVIDAKRGQVFSQLFRRGEGDTIGAATEIFCLEPGELLKRLKDMTARPVMAAGNGLLAYHPLFEADRRVETWGIDDRRHQVSGAFHLAAAPAGPYDEESLLRVVPVYVRDPDADKTVLLRKKEPWLR